MAHYKGSSLSLVAKHVGSTLNGRDDRLYDGVNVTAWRDDVRALPALIELAYVPPTSVDAPETYRSSFCYPLNAVYCSSVSALLS